MQAQDRFNAAQPKMREYRRGQCGRPIDTEFRAVERTKGAVAQFCASEGFGPELSAKSCHRRCAPRWRRRYRR